jgi:hypothetical protein
MNVTSTTERERERIKIEEKKNIDMSEIVLFRLHQSYRKGKREKRRERKYKRKNSYAV